MGYGRQVLSSLALVVDHMDHLVDATFLHLKMFNDSGEKHLGSCVIANEFASSINSKIVDFFFSSVFLSFHSNRLRSRKGNRVVKL